MLPLQRGPPRSRLLAALALALLVTWQLARQWPASLSSTTATGAANATLGFGAIYVVSKTGSPRRERLLRAANVTELRLTVPEQPAWTDDRIAAFRLDGDGPGVARGSMLAWMGHLHAIREFLASGEETALFIEDDVDWDIRLRTVQMPLVASALRSVLPAAPPSSAYPLGRPSAWDLLYVGHCGDYWHGTDAGFGPGHVQPADLAGTAHAAVADPTLPAPADLHPWTASLLANLGVEPQTRLVHASRFPLCTFGYGLTRGGATRLLAPDVAGRLRRDGPPAYDVAVLEACRDRGLRCWSANPELFHHAYGPSIIGGMDGSEGIPPVDVAGRDQADRRGETPNIDCGFADGAFDFDDADADRLRWLRREVGRRGRCLKEGRLPSSA